MEGHEVNLNELRDKLQDGGEENFEYFDELSGEWKELKNSIYFERNTGFPKPEKVAEPVSLIQIYDNKLDAVILIGLRDWVHQDNYKYDFEVRYIKVQDEIELFNTYFKIFKQLDPLITYAWNGNGFDYPYLYKRAKKLGLDTDNFSNHGSANLKEREFQGMMEWKIESHGHHFLDIKDIYKNFVFQMRPNYALDTIAEIELGEKKVDHSEYEAFDDFYTGKYIIPKDPTEAQKNSEIYKQAVQGNWDEVRELAHSDFVHYGVIDTYLIKRIDSAKNFTGIMVTLSEKMGVLLSDSMGTVKPWSQYIENKSYFNKQVVPKLNVSEDTIQIKGGYVADPIVGKHKWVLSADVNSMYPLLGMVGFNMSPETFIPKAKLPVDLREIILRYFNDEDEEARFKLPKEVWDKTSELLRKYNYSMGINGAIFSREKLGIIPEIVTEIYKQRKADKKKMFEYEQRKILIKGILKERNKEKTIRTKKGRSKI